VPSIARKVAPTIAAHPAPRGSRGSIDSLIKVKEKRK
jgi:hypothetical protein